MSRLDVLNGSVSFHLFQHVVRVQSLGLLGVNGGRYIHTYMYVYECISFICTYSMSCMYIICTCTFVLRIIINYHFT